MEYDNRDRFYWGNLTWPELRKAAARGRTPVVVQPIGAMEQHGARLPLNTDNYIVSRICHLAGVRAEGDLLVLPVFPYAFNAHHMDFPGVIAIQWQLLALARELRSRPNPADTRVLSPESGVWGSLQSRIKSLRSRAEC